MPTKYVSVNVPALDQVWDKGCLREEWDNVRFKEKVDSQGRNI